jgi:hypothetical protein
MVAKNETARLVEDLLGALTELRQTTRTTEVGIRRALQRTQRGMDLGTALSALDPAASRQAMNDALKAVEQARHAMRLAVFATALDQGISIGELGRIFGISRQLAARYAKEARGQS